MVVLEVSSSLAQPSLFYHLGVRESFSMTNNVLLCSQADLPDLQALRVGGPGAGGDQPRAGVAYPECQYLNVSLLQEEIPRQLQYICLYLVHIAGAYLLK